MLNAAEKSRELHRLPMHKTQVRCRGVNIRRCNPSSAQGGSSVKAHAINYYSQVKSALQNCRAWKSHAIKYRRNANYSTRGSVGVGVINT